MSNAIGLSKYVKTCYTLDYPVTISGTSTRSTGAQGLRKQHTGRIEEQGHLPVSTADTWSNLVPKFWSGPTIWAESAVQALRATKQFDLLRTLNYPHVYASCNVFHPEHKDLVRESMGKYCRSSGRRSFCVRIAIFQSYVLIWLNRIRSFVINLTNRFGRHIDRNNRIDGIDTMKAAVTYLQNKYSTLSPLRASR